MRVVSLNLDHGDATVVRRAIRLALDSCQCADYPGRALCPDCHALTATLRELDRLVKRPALGRTPLLTLVTANRHVHPTSPPSGDRLGETGRFRPLAGDGGRL